ncbi:hypothetical protein GRX03_01995 [Halovenus sp. WSH3]|uniref:Bacterio-opsin activator HTH domain protein n=1 Tax=Halovenus carboxidivorans TaxID=2692199 RepID=A0A6B0T675_9EURY|nr:helix-turn-helix domain-containing protein [Halovenus carboxidivorans]MXR50380.1 hypothetical protein [Halovenus carboxidivorans]
MLRITFETEPGDLLGRLHDSLDGGSTILDSVLQTDRTEWLAYLTVSDLDSPPVERVRELSDLELVYSDSYSAASDTALLLVRVHDEPCIARLLAEHRAIPHAIRLHDHHLSGTVTVDDWDHLQTIADEIETARDTFELVSVRQVDSVEPILGSDRLKQTAKGAVPTEHLRTLEVAYRTGYFDVPQTASAEEVADELGVSQSTFSKRLRRSAAALLALLFGEQHPGVAGTD